MDKFRLDPIPSILIESLRDIGYSFNTALADIVDNSISAGATNIDIVMPPGNDPVVAIVDNGSGLLREHLLEAMRLGSTDPKEERAKTDLGRFGLGMKTASFSQCRRLTVISKVGTKPYGFVWDLDEVVEQNDWVVTELTRFNEIPGFDLLHGTGTIVVWEKLDRLAYNLGGGKPDVDRILDEASDHLSLVFHRFLTGERGVRHVNIRVNYRNLEPIDPFNSKCTATQASPLDVPLRGVKMRAFTLPSRDAYDSLAEYEKYSLGDYVKNQGIYLYRAKRLIIYGTWLGLARKSAITQLCRVRIDIENDQDEMWKIDVKKASAQLPERVRSRIRSLIPEMKLPSRRVYKSRGAKQVDKNSEPVWSRFKGEEDTVFSINREHPSIKAYRDSLSSNDEQREFDSIMGLVESAFPVKALFYDLHTDAEHVRFRDIDKSELEDSAKAFFASLKVNGVDEDRIISIMRTSEPFASNWKETCRILGIEVKD